MKLLRALCAVFAVTGTLASAAPFSGIQIDGKDLIRIEIGSDEDDMPRGSGDQVTYLTNSNRKLKQRVHRLEQALRQMQDQIYRLEDINSRPIVAVAPVAAAKEYTCYIKTTFKGTVYGKGGSEVEAKAKALEKCSEVDSMGFNCEDSHVRCGN